MNFFSRKELSNLIGKHNVLLAILSFVLILSIFGYVGLLNEPPQSTHLWRQSDCASLALNYHQHGMDFFQPQIHNLHADGHTTGYAISECPYIYYLVAGLYKVLGYNHWVYRLVWSLILLLGFVALYRYILHFLDSKIYSFLLVLIVLASPVIIFYGNSFLPDVPALMFTLAGWMVFANWLRDRRYTKLWFVAILFMLGGLLKVTALISFFALAGVWFIELLGWKLGERGKFIFEKKWKSVIPFLSVFAVIVAWYLWAWNYNDTHSTKYFSMRTCPIWDVTSCCNCTFGDILNQVKTLWLPHLFSKPMQLLLLICIPFLMVYRRFANRFLLAITVLTFLGTALYIAIWFAAFHDHDYYFINLYIFPVFLLLTSLYALKIRFPKVFSSRYFMVFLAAIMLYGIHYTYFKQRLRYRGWMNAEHRKFADIRGIAPLVGKLGILSNDLIISIPDRTPNYTLYILNRKGWSIFGAQAVDSASLARRIEGGAKFLFVSNFEETLSQRPYIAHFTGNPVGSFNNLKVFRLDSKPHPLRIEQVIDTLLNFKCDTERVSPTDNELLLTTNEQITAKGAKQVNNQQSLSGIYSLLVSKDKPFGFTLTIPANPNTTLTVSVWRKSLAGKGFLVVSGKSSSNFYQTQNTGEVDPETGWEKLTLTVTLSNDLSEKSFKVYVWNPEDDDAYFDDLEVTVTHIIHQIIPNPYVQR
jgi:hypothetical protein